MTRPLFPWVVGLVCLWAPAAGAQQVLEINFDGGRTIFESELRAMHTTVAIDWDRRLLYVDDAEEPLGIMAFSLDTGEWVRTIRTPRGQGPYEFAQGRRGIAIGPDGGLYVAGFVRIIEYDPEGTPFGSWTPEVPVARKVCNFGGVPALPTQGGVVRRGPDGTSVPVGPVRARGHRIEGESADELTTIRERLRNATIACTDDRAYVLMSHVEGEPDSLLVYHRNGEAGALAVPTEDAFERPACIKAAEHRFDGSLIRPVRPCPHWSKGARLSFDDRGNVVLLGIDGSTHGALIHPETGCYALIRGTVDHPHKPIGVYADSVLVFRRPFRVTREGADIYRSISSTANGVSIHPLRRISGEPCSGMLPAVKSVDSDYEPGQMGAGPRPS